MFIKLYIIIGLTLVAWTSGRRAEKNPEKFSKDIMGLAFWLATIVVAAIWPVFVCWAIYDAARLYR